jgi:hypothetical protein
MIQMSEYTDSQLEETIANLKLEHQKILKLMSDYPVKIDLGILVLSDPPQKIPMSRNVLARTKTSMEKLQEQGLVNYQDDQYFLTNLGKSIVSQLHYKDTNKKSITREEPRINELFELYKQGLSYQDIGKEHSISRQRVHKILSVHPDFESVKREQKEEKSRLKVAKQLEIEKELYKRSIGFLYPEKVAELWDYEKNGDLDPDTISAGSSVEIWLKCNKGHSWLKKVGEITTSWKRKTSGCPTCAGKSKKHQKQPFLIDAYPDLVNQYWDYEKNLNLDPKFIPCKSNKKAYLKCPHDDNKWQVQISLMINQQWSKNNPGCSVCNRREDRKKGTWQKRQFVGIEFPEQVEKYWFYDANIKRGLDPMELTTKSSKKAFFRCPIDGHVWRATIGTIAGTSWKNGNSGCPACRGLVTTENTSLISLYPEFIKQYWDYEKNDAIEIYPGELTKGSNKEAWFKCPIHNYKWETRILSITRASWDRGNNGCARCGSGWTTEAIRQFVASLEEYIPDLTPAERYKIFEQSGVLNTGNKENLTIINDIIKGKLSGTKLKRFLKKEEIQDVQLESNDFINADDELKIIDGDTSQHTFHDKDKSIDHELDSEEEKNSQDNLPKVSIQKSLEFLNSQVVASADQEAIEFFIASRRNRIWAEIFEDESAIEVLEEFETSNDEGYGRRVRDEFLDQYYQAKNMKIPDDWSFHINGKIVPPNLMQKLAAVLLRKQKRMLNLSLTGTGKTIGGILSSRIIDARLTVIICPLDTIENWHSEIKNVFPNSKVTTRNFNPYWENIDEGHHYIILNHEKFQQLTTASNIRQLVERFPIDLIIVDEIHKCKQRSDDQSKRRQMVMALITNAKEVNENLHVLGMSATPIINNLREGKSLVELVSGLDRSDLGEKATTNNCMKLYQAFVTLGIRSKVKPKILVDKIRIPIDCSELVDEIREEGTSVLKMEQILTKARIPIIVKELRPKTIVYTHFVKGITDQLKEAIEAAGLTVGFHVGDDKSGFNEFINGSTDILIASSAMSVGVDGFQKVCNRLILNIPPWTSAELEQLEGRLNRQGQFSDTLTIIMPITYGDDNGEHWSWDEGRLARLENKQTIADAAVDGIIPEGQLITESQAFRNLRQWLERLKTGVQKPIIRPKIFVPLPDDDLVDVKRRYANYGDFSKMNARWNSSYSQTTYQRLQENPEEWMQYHTLYQEARKTWEIIPYQETIKWLQKRSGLVVADFGCGEALIAKEVSHLHTIYNFDFIAINDSVIECDMAKVPLEDNCLDIAIFNLSLMGKNIDQYIREAARTLRLDGQLWIYEPSSHIKNIDNFITMLKQAGFSVTEPVEQYKFLHIIAIKSI